MRKSVVAALLILAGLPLPVLSQTPSSAGPREDDEGCWSSGRLTSHWSRAVLRRLEGLGDLSAQSSGGGPDLCHIQALLLESAEDADSPGEAALRQGWLDQLSQEFPGLHSSARTGLLGLAASVGASSVEGNVVPGFGEFAPDRTGAIRTDDRRTLTASGDLALQLHPRLVLLFRGRGDSSGLSVPRVEAVASLSNLGLSIGRGGIGGGYARGGSVVVSEGATVDRFEVGTVRPVRLPYVGTVLGNTTFSTFVGRVDDGRHEGLPFLWGASGSVQPHPRATLSINRAAFFAGEGRPPVTGRRVLGMLLGSVAEIGFENQVVAVELRVRLPTESALPVTAYLEWGAEDAAGAFIDVPGRVVGVFLPEVPLVPYMTAGAEHTVFRGSCCGNPEWYRHWSFPGSWALGTEPLGHPLGGHGEEWLAYSDLFLGSRGQIQLEMSAFWRDRGGENLYVPGRLGVSRGGDVGMRWRIRPGGEIFGAFSAERGEDWREASFELGGRLFMQDR